MFKAVLVDAGSHSLGQNIHLAEGIAYQGKDTPYNRDSYGKMDSLKEKNTAVLDDFH